MLFLQNHDQIGNRAFGDRLTRLARSRGARGRDRAAAALSADPAAVHGRGGRQPHARSCSSPIITANWPRRCAKAGAASSRPSPASRRRGGRTFPIPMRLRPSRAVARSPRMRRGGRCISSSPYACAPRPWRRTWPARGRSRRRPAARPASRRAGGWATAPCWRCSAISATPRRGRSAEGRSVVRDAHRRQRRCSWRQARGACHRRLPGSRKVNEEAVLARARSAGIAVDWTDAYGASRKGSERSRCAACSRRWTASMPRSARRRCSPRALAGRSRFPASMTTIRPSWRWKTAT